MPDPSPPAHVQDGKMARQPARQQDGKTEDGKTRRQPQDSRQHAIHDDTYSCGGGSCNLFRRPSCSLNITISLDNQHLDHLTWITSLRSPCLLVCLRQACQLPCFT